MPSSVPESTLLLFLCTSYSILLSIMLITIVLVLFASTSTSLSLTTTCPCLCWCWCPCLCLCLAVIVVIGFVFIVTCIFSWWTVTITLVSLFRFCILPPFWFVHSISTTLTPLFSPSLILMHAHFRLIFSYLFIISAVPPSIFPLISQIWQHRPITFPPCPYHPCRPWPSCSAVVIVSCWVLPFSP